MRWLFLLSVLIYSLTAQLVIDLNGTIEYIPFESNETISSIQVGWITVMSCETNGSEPSFIFDYSADDIVTLAENAISLRIQPPGGQFHANYTDLTVTAMPYSTPIVDYLNNHLEVSYDGTGSDGTGWTSANSSNWIGSTSAKARLHNRCINHGKYYDIRSKIYHSCNNADGLHIFPDMLDEIGNAVCHWSSHLYTKIPVGIEILFGYSLEPTKSSVEFGTFRIIAIVIICASIPCVLIISFKYYKRRSEQNRYLNSGDNYDYNSVENNESYTQMVQK